MSYFVVDVESDGPAPGLYSMVCFGAVLVKDMSIIYYDTTRPISDNYQHEALAISGFSRKEHLEFRDPALAMKDFDYWIKLHNTNGKPKLITDNPSYDYAFLNYYFHKYIGSNPFGYSARRIGDLYCGIEKDEFAKWTHLRKTKADHSPVNDALGNAEVLHHMKNEMGLKIKF